MLIDWKQPSLFLFCWYSFANLSFICFSISTESLAITRCMASGHGDKVLSNAGQQKWYSLPKNNISKEKSFQLLRCPGPHGGRTAAIIVTFEWSINDKQFLRTQIWTLWASAEHMQPWVKCSHLRMTGLNLITACELVLSQANDLLCWAVFVILKPWDLSDPRFPLPSAISHYAKLTCVTFTPLGYTSILSLW